jgi:hypothetical protein
VGHEVFVATSQVGYDGGKVAWTMPGELEYCVPIEPYLHKQTVRTVYGGIHYNPSYKGSRSRRSQSEAGPRKKLVQNPS